MDRPALDVTTMDPADRSSDRMRRAQIPAGRVLAVGALLLAAIAPFGWWQHTHDPVVPPTPFADDCARADVLGSLVLVAFAAESDDRGTELDAALSELELASRIAHCSVLHRVLPDDPERDALIERFGIATTPAFVLSSHAGAAIGDPAIGLGHGAIAALLDRSRHHDRAEVRRLAGHAER